MAVPLIQIHNVRKSFGSNTVLDGVDLTIERGRVTSIIGRSGVGKSVLLKHLVGLLIPDSGEILYHEKSLLRMRGAERKKMKNRISYMFQNMALFDSMTVFENIALPLVENTNWTRAVVRGAVMARIEQLDLGEIAEQYPAQISGGMRKRVALARALITEPEIVLFDEPTTGLDPIRKNTVHAMIERYQKEFSFTAVIVTHDIPDVFAISQKVAMLEGGKILFEGTSEEILASSDRDVRRLLNGGTHPEEAGGGPGSEPREELRVMRSRSVEVSVGIFVAIGLVCVAYLAIRLGKMDLLGDDHFYLTAKFGSVSGLKEGGIVDIAGVQVGQVDEITLSDDMEAVVRLKIHNAYLGKIDEETIASVKTSGLIGDKYIRLEPGGSEIALKNGGEIIEVESAIDLEELISKYVFGGV